MSFSLKRMLCTMSVIALILSGCTGASESTSSDSPTQPDSAASQSRADSAPASQSTDSAGKELEGKLLGVIMPSATHGYTGEAVYFAEERIKELAAEYGFEYKFLTASESSEQANYVDTLISAKADTIMIWPMNGDELRAAAQNAIDAGIKLIVYDRLIENLEPDGNVRGADENVGILQAKYFNEYLKDEIAAGETINCLEFKGDASTVSTYRSNGFVDTIDKQITIVQSFVTDWQRQKGMEQMETYLNTKSVEEIEALQAIYTHDDEVTMGVLQALRDYSGPAKLNMKVLGGNGGRKENLQQFADPGVGDMIMVTCDWSTTIIRNGIDKTVELMRTGEAEDLYLMPTHLIDYDGTLAKQIDPNGMSVEEYMQSDSYTLRYAVFD